MDSNLLLNIHRMLVYIRSDISNNINVELLKKIRHCVNEEMENTQFIMLVSDVDSTLIKNLDVKNGEKIQIYGREKTFMTEMLDVVVNALECRNYEMAYDIVDMLHVLPELMNLEKSKLQKKYCDTYVKPVMKKWKIQEYRCVKKYFK